MGDITLMGEHTKNYEEIKYLAGLFNKAYEERLYVKAMNHYWKAIKLGGLNDLEREEIYGVRGERGVILKRGLFDEEKVIYAMEKKIFGDKKNGNGDRKKHDKRYDYFRKPADVSKTGAGEEETEGPYAENSVKSQEEIPVQTETDETDAECIAV